MPSRATLSSFASPATVCSGASAKSEKRLKNRLASRFARNLTSSFSTSRRATSRLDSIIGTTTSVACSGGMPSRKSISGSASGGSKEMTSALTICADSSLRGNRANTPSTSSITLCRMPASHASANERIVKAKVSATMPVRYTGVAWRRTLRTSRIRNGMRAWVSASSLKMPSSIR